MLGSRGTIFNRNSNIDFSIFGAVLRKCYLFFRCGIAVLQNQAACGI